MPIVLVGSVGRCLGSACSELQCGFSPSRLWPQAEQRVRDLEDEADAGAGAGGASKSELEAQVRAARREAEDERENADRLRRRIDSLQEEAAASRGDQGRSDTKEELSRLRERLQDQERCVMEERQGRAKWKSEFEKLVEEAEALRAERDTLMASLSSAREHMEEQGREVATLRAALADIRGQLSSALASGGSGGFGEFARLREDHFRVSAELERVKRAHDAAVRHRMGDRGASGGGGGGGEDLRVRSRDVGGLSARGDDWGYGSRRGLAAAGAAAVLHAGRAGAGEGSSLGEPPSARGRGPSPAYSGRAGDGGMAVGRAGKTSARDGPRGRGPSVRARAHGRDAGRGASESEEEEGGSGSDVYGRLYARGKARVERARSRSKDRPKQLKPKGSAYQPRALAFNKARAKELRGMPEALRRVVDSEENSRIYIDVSGRPRR